MLRHSHVAIKHYPWVSDSVNWSNAIAKKLNVILNKAKLRSCLRSLLKPNQFRFRVYLSTLLKLNFFSLDFQLQPSKIHNPTLTISSNKTIQPVSSARNLGIILSLIPIFLFPSDHISYISKSCFSHIRDLRRIRNTSDHKTTCTMHNFSHSL